MDRRKAIQKGTVLPFPGMPCEIGEEIGRGSNALVYEGCYRDALDSGNIHRILVKELFPLHPDGKIFRLEDGSICVEPEGQETFQIHRSSFEAGNRAHLTLLESCPEQIGANLNTFRFNNTLYTLLGVSGGDSLGTRQPGPARSLRACASRMLTILDALDVFHRNGLAHLDLAPDNILLLGSGRQERALLIDYNSTVAIGLPQPAGAYAFSIKQGYTAPEIRSGRIREIGFASDLYSVTAVFYRLLTGVSLTSFQMIRPAPPDISGCPCVKDEPETVKVWVQEILRRGLQTLPGRRYQSVAQMQKDLEELIDRIDGVGVTHWALWEAGRKQADRMIRENPSLSFLRNAAQLFPLQVSDGIQSFPAGPYIRNLRENCILLAGGGMGKTSSLLHLALSGEKRYSPDCTAVLYLSLYGWQAGESQYIMDHLLEGLRFRADTRTFEDARKAMREILDCPLETPHGTKPALLLLLDGLNEITGDPKPLLDEIRSLAGLRGIRLVIASRTEEPALPFVPLRLTELTEETLGNVLAGSGLLMPESPALQTLLRTPLMLSMYLQSGQADGHLLHISSADSLLQAYLLSLKEKVLQDMPEKTDRRWQIEAAMDLVLPAIAAEISRRGCALEDRQLLSVTERCFSLLTGRLSRRFFPQWIGRTAAIRGDARNAEEWYGRIVHDLLWKQFGLIVRDGEGRYLIAHQVIAEYLLKKDKENRRTVRRYHGIRSVFSALYICVFLAAGFLAYQAFMAPKPYDESMASGLMAEIGSAYAAAANQNEQLARLTDCAVSDPESFENQLDIYTNSHSNEITISAHALTTLSKMMKTGQVMPWSGKPMNAELCQRLLELAGSRKEEYDRFSAVLAFVMTDPDAFRLYGSGFPRLLSVLLETDGKMTAVLYRMVCAPHLTGEYSNHPFSAYFSVRQNKIMSETKDFPSLEDLDALEIYRQYSLEDLLDSDAFKAYEKYMQDDM